MSGSQRGFDWESAAAEGIVGILVTFAILIAIAAATMVIILCTEIGRIYLAHAGKGGKVAWVLWGALAAFLLALLVSLYLTSSPGHEMQGVYLAAWSYFVYVVVVEACDIVGRKETEPEQVNLSDLDTYLGTFTPPTPVTNGQAKVPEGVR